MRRFLYLAGWTYVLIAASILWLRPSRAAHYDFTFHVQATPVEAETSASAWFAQVKPFCNPLEVEVRLRSFPPPEGRDGAGFASACWAVAGKIDRARQILAALPAEDQQFAAGIVFDIGHPVADAGDDLSAGPIMEMVVEFQPWNYMALYHAGISYDATGRHEQAKRHLAEFLRIYAGEDGWRGNARSVLARLNGEVSK